MEDKRDVHYVAEKAVVGVNHADGDGQVLELQEVLCIEQFDDPDEIIAGLILERNGNAIVAYGESGHHGEGILKHEIELIEKLQAKFGLKTVFLEEDKAQTPNLLQYYLTGVMPAELERYLAAGFVRQDALPHTYKVELVKKLKELGVHVEFIDRDNARDRDADWSGKIKHVIGDNVDGLYLVIAGEGHTAHLPITSSTCTTKPLVRWLDESYPGATIAVISMNIDENRPPSHSCLLENKVSVDLGRIGVHGGNLGIILKKSPYDSSRMYTGNDQIAGDSYDVLAVSYGRNLCKFSY